MPQRGENTWKSVKKPKSENRSVPKLKKLQIKHGKVRVKLTKNHKGPVKKREVELNLCMKIK